MPIKLAVISLLLSATNFATSKDLDLAAPAASFKSLSHTSELVHRRHERQSTVWRYPGK